MVFISRKQINFRLSDDDFSKLSRSAQVYGLTPTRYAKKIIMKSHLAKPKFDAQMQKDLYRQVIGMASNLNQVAHKINTDSHAFSDSEFSALRQEVQDLLRQLK